MVFSDLLASCIISIFLTWCFYLVTKKGKRRKIGLIWVFIILLFTTWAGGIWIKPLGPAWLGIHWLSFILTGTVVTLILIITIPPEPPKGRHETIDMLETLEEEREMEKAAYVTLSVFFWALLILLILAILLRYILGV